MSPIAYYQAQKAKYDLLLANVLHKADTASRLRFWLVIGTLLCGWYAYRGGQNWQWWLTAAVFAGFIAMVRRHTALQNEKKLLDIHLLIIVNELNGLNGDISQFDPGEGYIDIAHPYSYDLDLFGKGSVYQLLCRAVTSGGAALLAKRLSSMTMEQTEVTTRQEIIRELSVMPELLQEFRAAGIALPEGATDQARVKKWLQGKDAFINQTLVRFAAIVMPLLSVACIGWSVFLGAVYSGITLVILANWLLLGAFQKKIKLAVQQIGNTAPIIDKYAALLSQVAAGDFKSGWLHATSVTAKTSVTEIIRFKKLVHLFDSRSNGMIGPLMNTLFLFDFYCLLQLEGWRKKHNALMVKAVDNMIITDVFVSCAVYAFNHPENIYPEINANNLVIKAADLKHPLLQSGSAVGNDIRLGSEEQIYLLTGANMTGKSTFIRTIGVSNVMANLGLPLPAAALSLPLLDMFTSMRITDSVQEDISYFRAELNRIKTIMDKVKDARHHYLVLLDEPLRGTNSADKQQGTRAIVENLLRFNAIGIVATHDTALCDMETIHQGKISNYHFESSIEQGGLKFDFKLKNGPSTSNNATVLMRLMGIIS